MKRKNSPISAGATVSRVMILVTAVLLAIFWVVPHGIAKTRTVTLVHTNNVTGHLFACPT